MKMISLIAAIAFLTLAGFAIEQNCIPGSASQCGSGGGNTGGSGGTTSSCTVTTYCYSNKVLVGSVTCTSAKNDCQRGPGYVRCDGVRTECT